MIYWHVEEVELILTSWHQCCDTFIPSDDPLDIDTFSEEFDLRMRSHHQIQNYLSWTIVFRFGRGPSSTCSTIPRPTFSTSSTSNPPAQPSLQRPGSAAPHLQVSPEDQIHVQIMIMITKLMSNISSDDPRPPTSDTQLRFDRRSAIWLGLRRADEEPLWPDESVADLWVKYRWFETVTFASKISYSICICIDCVISFSFCLFWSYESDSCLGNANDDDDDGDDDDDDDIWKHLDVVSYQQESLFPENCLLTSAVGKILFKIKTDH